ncbi:fimbrial protein [Bacteroides thetaiotaomicron]|uniref:fimbrial protein n=1 Tax=Bacteroides thetaiotaomicron TaxID=818 RepID=UPI003261B4EB
MKTRQKNILTLLVAMLLTVGLSSCTEDLLFEERARVTEGLPARVTLDFRSEKSRVETRAAQDATYEDRVNNLYVFIFNPAGEVHYRNFFTDGISYSSGDYSKGSVMIETTSLNEVQIVCIANLSTTSVRSGYDVELSDMEAITSLSDLEAYVMKMDEKTVERSTQFMMTGYAYDDKNPTSNLVNIPGTESGSASLECTLRPERTDARVEFVVKTEKPSDKEWTELDFRPRGWRVVNVPAQSLLLPRETGDADGDDCAYFTTEEMPFETTERDENYLYTSGGFVFYMPENRKTPVQSIADGGLTPAERYALREERGHENEGNEYPDKPGQQFENGDFAYAPANATYVEMSGTLSYKDAAGYTVNADVTFTVHLGYADGNPNDYDTRRNTRYIYTVTLRGINDIQLEVTSDGEEDEPRPGYEGNVIFSQEGLHELDAHYDRELITIDRSMVPSMTWGVQTPFDKAIYAGDFGDMDKPENAGINDYKWIKFAINDDYGQDDKLFVKYPGDQNYKGGDNKPSGYDGHASYPAARLLDVHQLLQRLKQEYENGQISGLVAVTAFIDEYVYVREPDDPNTAENNTPLLSQWRRYVEVEDRLLYFIDGDNSRYSPDGASSVVKAIQTFKQKSIRTVYNVNKSEGDLRTAWGLESRMEGRRWAEGNVSNGTSTSNGRLNTIRCILGLDYTTNGDLHWTKVLNTSEHYGLNPGYQDALHAVLLRNRDLNGDNIVQPNEIRWYLAAIDQLVDLYIGEYALDDASRLYPQNAADRDNQTYWHYTSSSADGDHSWVLWAEECAALGNYSASSDIVKGQYTYRCIRNLGIGLDEPETEPTALIPNVTQAESDGTYLIDVSNLSEKARRLSYEASTLPTHNDQSPYNRPYAKFRVAASDQDYPAPGINVDGLNRWSWKNDQKWSWYQTASITPKGYRVPNLRELLIMGTRLPASAWKTYEGEWGWPITIYRHSSKAMYMTYTSFSRGTYNGDGSISGKNGGFRFNAEDNSIGATGTNADDGYVRGVKDEQ